MDKNTYFIWNGKYVGDSLLFWREGKAGYTTNIDEAHHFTLEEAQRICRPENFDRFIDSKHCHDTATLQVNANRVDHDLLGKEVTNG